MLSHPEYQLIVEQAPILIWRARLDKLCDYFNERWLAFRGRSYEQEFGNGWAEGVHPDDLERCLHIYVQSFDQREVFEMNYRLMRHDGVYRWIHDRGVPVYGERGDFAGYVGSCIDVTERIEAERALAEARDAELQRVSKLLPVCAWCKKIRTDDGYWREVDVYFQEQHQRLTHCMCSDCNTRMLGELEQTLRREGRSLPGVVRLDESPS